jgi:hypothetical protein
MLAPKAIGDRVEMIRASVARNMSADGMLAKIGKALTKPEVINARMLFESDESVMLPAGDTAWRASNVMSWLANQTESTERKLDLQGLAHQLAA